MISFCKKNTMDKKTIIKQLELQPHPFEGGYFRRTYEADIRVNRDGKSRHIMTSIYYLLTNDSPVGLLNKNTSDIIHYHHLGSAIEYQLISPEGKLETQVLGPGLAKGQQLQLLVKGGYWKAARLLTGEYGLLSEAVAPGFEYEDNQLATTEDFGQQFPHLLEQMTGFIKE